MTPQANKRVAPLLLTRHCHSFLQKRMSDWLLYTHSDCFFLSEDGHLFIDHWMTMSIQVTIQLSFESGWAFVEVTNFPSFQIAIWGTSVYFRMPIQPTADLQTKRQVGYVFTSPFHTSRIWHKVNFLSWFSQAQSIPSPRLVVLPRPVCSTIYP